jgi:hypothetical protein
MKIWRSSLNKCERNTASLKIDAQPSHIFVPSVRIKMAAAPAAPTADMDEIKDSLMEVLTTMTDLTLQFNEMQPKELDATITNCLKYKVPPAVMISLYQLGTQIASLRTLRWNLFVRNEKVRESSAAATTATTTTATASATAVVGDPAPVASQAEEEEAVSAAPKTNPYNAFVKEMRPVIAKENPEMTPQDVIKELGRRWTALKAAAVPIPVQAPVPAVSEKSKSEKEPESPTAEPKKRAAAAKKKAEPATDPAVPPVAAAAVVKEGPSPTPPADTKKRGGGKKATDNEIASAPESAPAAAPAPSPSVPEPAAPAKKTTSKKAAAAAPEPVPVPSAPVLQTTKDESSSDSEDDGKTKKKKAIPKYIKTLVWNQYVGEHRAEASCACCRKTQINVRHFHCGHVLAEAKGGDSTLNNLRPICSNCNLAMGTMSMNEFAEKFFGWKVT